MPKPNVTVTFDAAETKAAFANAAQRKLEWCGTGAYSVQWVPQEGDGPVDHYRLSVERPS